MSVKGATKDVHGSEGGGGGGECDGSGASIPGASLNLINSITGAAIVAIPHAIQQCGLCLGMFLLVFLAYGIHQIITVLMECAIRAGELNLEDLTEHHFGTRGYIFAATVMLLYAFGSMVACMVVVGDTLPPAIDDLFGFESLRTRDEIVVIVAVIVVLPLSLVRNISSLAFASGIAFMAIVVLVIGVLTQGPAEAHSQEISFDMEDITVVNKHVFRGIGVLSFHYVCQHSCLLIFKSLDVPSMDTVKDVSRISLGAVLLFSILIGLGGYVFFGQSIDGNVLNNFKTHNAAVSLARMCMAVNMIFTYPMELFVVRHAFYSLVNRMHNNSQNSDYDLADSLSQHSSVDSTSDSLQSVSLGSSNSSNGSRRSHEYDECSDDGIPLVKWNSLGVSSLGKGTVATISRDHEEGAPPTVLHFLMTVFLWSLSLAIAIGFDDVSVVLALSGIVAASILGYILPVAIYLKTHEGKVRSKFSWVYAGAMKGQLRNNNEIVDDANIAEQNDFNNNILFFIVLGVFGVCSLLVGLGIEVLSVFGITREIDPTVNY